MSTAFPSALDTSTTLYDLVNNAQAALAAGYTAGGTTLDLDSAALFPATGGIIYVGNERTTYTGKTSNQLTGVTALSNNYPSSTAVVMYLDAEHVEVLRDAIIAVETRVGVTGSTVAGTLTKRIADLEGAGGETIIISAKTGAYTVVAGDLGAIIDCTSGTFSVSYTAAATLGSGFHNWVWNSGTGVITVDPNGAETIDGKSTLVLRQGEGVQVVCDGTNFQTGDKKATRGYSENIAATATAPAASGTSAMARGPGAVASANYSLADGVNSGGNGSQAVTGSGAVALAGSYTSGADAFAVMVVNNTSSYGAQAANALTGGYQNKCSSSGAYSTSWGGSANISSANWSTTLGGRSCVAAFDYSVGAGYLGTPNAVAQFAFGHGSGNPAQWTILPLLKTTTDATASVLSSNASAAGASNQLILPNNTAVTFDGLVVARQQAADGTACASWKVEGLIRREANAGTTTLVASTVTAISNVPGWTLALSADTTNGGLAVTFTGAAATDIRCFAKLRTADATYA